MEAYKIPTRDAEAEFVEKKSRFIGRIWVTETEEEALERIKAMRQKHWDATHNVYAYIIHGGPTRFSDDGEPGGTAGMPVLEVLRGRELENVCCVVTRYFGGTLLGTGGLVRAYSRAARDAAQAAGCSVKQVWQRIDLPAPYSEFERLRQETERAGGILLDTEYSAQILMHVMLPKAAASAFLNRITDVTSGRVRGEAGAEEYRAFPTEK